MPVTDMVIKNVLGYLLIRFNTIDRADTLNYLV